MKGGGLGDEELGRAVLRQEGYDSSLIVCTGALKVGTKPRQGLHNRLGVRRRVDGGTTHVSEVGPFLKAHGRLYHSTRGEVSGFGRGSGSGGAEQRLDGGSDFGVRRLRGEVPGNSLDGGEVVAVDGHHLPAVRLVARGGVLGLRPGGGWGEGPGRGPCCRMWVQEGGTSNGNPRLLGSDGGEPLSRAAVSSDCVGRRHFVSI